MFSPYPAKRPDRDSIVLMPPHSHLYPSVEDGLTSVWKTCFVTFKNQRKAHRRIVDPAINILSNTNSFRVLFVVSNPH